MGFTRSLAREVGKLGITVNAIAPGFMDTEMTGAMDEDQREQIARRSALRRLAEPTTSQKRSNTSSVRAATTSPVQRHGRRRQYGIDFRPFPRKRESSATSQFGSHRPGSPFVGRTEVGSAYQVGL